MEKIELYCKKCNHKLTKEPIIEIENNKLNDKNGEKLLPLGCFTKNTNFLFDMEITYLINNDSILLDNHEDPDRYLGCCGPSEMSKYNQVCPNCNEEIGVEILVLVMTINFISLQIIVILCIKIQVSTTIKNAISVK